MRRQKEYDDEFYQEFPPEEFDDLPPDEAATTSSWYNKGKEPPELVSTSQAINLTCTLAAISGLFSLFLYFADQRSNAVRRISIQSIALSGGYLIVAIILRLASLFFGIIPFLGAIMAFVFGLLFIALSIVVIALKIRMMFQAYRGYAYLLPIVGGALRRFE